MRTKQIQLTELAACYLKGELNPGWVQRGSQSVSEGANLGSLAAVGVLAAQGGRHQEGSPCVPLGHPPADESILSRVGGPECSPSGVCALEQLARVRQGPQLSGLGPTGS